MPRQIRSIPFLIALVIILPCIASAQQVSTPPSSPSLNEILDRAGAETSKYIEAFKNLLSEESRTIETFDKHGELKRTTKIRSTFIVYQLTKDQNQSVEFRNILSVDGDQLGDADKHAQDFFGKVMKAESSKKEIQELRKESSRYDGELVINGMTLFQSPVLAARLRPVFEFKLAGHSTIDGADVYEISYVQKSESPIIKVNVKGDPEPGETSIEYDVDSDVHGDLNGRLRGTIWIDAATFQVRREHRELTVQPEDTASPLPAIVNEFEFQNSDFGILTPKRITHLQSRIKGKGEAPAKEIKVTMEYANFSKPDVEIKSSEVKSPPKQ